MATRVLVVPGGPGFGARYLHSLNVLLHGCEVSYCETPGPLIEDHVRQVEAARSESGASVVLGHSFGGLVACLHALAFPGRAAAVILLDPDPATFAEWEAFRGCVSDRRRPEDKASMDQLSARPAWKTRPELVSDYFRCALASYFADPKDAALLRFGFSADSMGRIESLTLAVRADLGPWDLTEEQIPVPALLIHGEQSVFARSSPRTLARLFPAGESHVLPSVGHFPHLEAPQKVQELTEQFLRAHSFGLQLPESP